VAIKIGRQLPTVNAIEFLTLRTRNALRENAAEFHRQVRGLTDFIEFSEDDRSSDDDDDNNVDSLVEKKTVRAAAAATDRGSRVVAERPGGPSTPWEGQRSAAEAQRANRPGTLAPLPGPGRASCRAALHKARYVRNVALCSRRRGEDAGRRGGCKGRDRMA